MPRHRESGLNVARRKRSDGTVVEYYYERGTKRFLGHDRAGALKAIGHAPAIEPATEEGTFGWLIDRFLASPKNNQKWQPRTKNLYGGYLKQMRAAFGDLQFQAFTIDHLEQIQIEFQGQPRKCNQIVGLIRQIFNYAVRQKLMISNPFSRPGMLPTPPRDEIWSQEDEDAFLAAAPPKMKLAFALLLYTCQRLGDVLSMTKGQVYEREVNGRPRLLTNVRQQKTDELVGVLVHEKLEPLLRERLEQLDASVMLVSSPRGMEWMQRNFSRAWDKTAVKAGVAGRVQRRDLRRTGVVRLAAHGVSVPLLASVTGWEVDYTQRIVDTYLPRRTELAIQAMLMWEQGQPTNQTVVPLRRKV